MAPVPGDSANTPAWHIDAAWGPSTPSLDQLVGAGDAGGLNFFRSIVTFLAAGALNSP